MPEKLYWTWDTVRQAAAIIATTQLPLRGRPAHFVYGVPRGGVYAALALVKECSWEVYLTDKPERADVIVDDIIDTGKTRDRYKKQFPDKPFVALVDKTNGYKDLRPWIVFPWEAQSDEDGPEDNIRRILQYIGEDPQREGLLETPARVVRSYNELFAGYKQDPAAMLKTFEDGACDEMVLLKEIELTSFCEHHMLPFTGQAHIAYLPDKRIVGVSKLARLLEVFARRLQVQERLTTQVTKALDEHLKPKGSACVISAKHQCMTCRGVNKQHSIMVTSSLTGAFQKPEVRAEFYNLISRVM